MLITIESFWKPENSTNSRYNLFYLETSIGKIYSPLQILFRNFGLYSTITEEQLLATLASHHLKYYNQDLYSTLVEKVSKHSPKYITDKLLRFGESPKAIKTLYQEESIYQAIKDDKVCQYLYFDEYNFRNYDYETLINQKDLEEKIFYFAAGDIEITHQVNRFNYMGLPYYYNIDFLLRQLDPTKMDDEETKNYLLPHLPDNFKNNQKLWLHLLPLPQTFIEITDITFRIEHFKNYQTTNKKKKDLERFLLSIPIETLKKYPFLLKEVEKSKNLKKLLLFPKTPPQVKKLPQPPSKEKSHSSIESISSKEITSSNFPNLSQQPSPLSYPEYLYKKYITKFPIEFQHSISNAPSLKNKLVKYLKALFQQPKNFFIINHDENLSPADFYDLIDLLSILEPSLSQSVQITVLQERSQELTNYIYTITTILKPNSFNTTKKDNIKETFAIKVIESKILFHHEKNILLKILTNTITAYDINYLTNQARKTKLEISILVSNPSLSSKILNDLTKDATITKEDYFQTIQSYQKYTDKYSYIKQKIKRHPKTN